MESVSILYLDGSKEEERSGETNRISLAQFTFPPSGYTVTLHLGENSRPLNETRGVPLTTVLP